MSRYFKQFRHGEGEARRKLHERLAREEMGDAAWEEEASHTDQRGFRIAGLLFIAVLGAIVLGLAILD